MSADEIRLPLGSLLRSLLKIAAIGIAAGVALALAGILALTYAAPEALKLGLRAVWVALGWLAGIVG